MKIVMFSINPLYHDRVTGGASKHLYHISRYLGELGHEVVVLCAKPKGTADHFKWAENVTVLPELAFNLPFPQPYAVSGADLALMVEKLSDTLRGADRFYIHDGEWLLPDVYEKIPTVISFRDNIYPESVLGTFTGKADEIVCVSEYSSSVIEHTAGRFYPDLKERMHLVHNGIDFGVFSDVDSSRLARRLGVDPTRDFIILHPHRPEAGKGLPETIQVTARLVNDYQMTNIKVLVPEWIGEMTSSVDSEFYNAMMRLMADLGVLDHFKFIPWLPIERMPELYSLGNVTLCLGSIVEAFGNVAYESMACGTPSIVARVGVHRTLLPDELVAKVHFGDIDGAVDAVLAINEGSDKIEKGTTRYLQSKLDFDKQVKAYAEIITSCEKRDVLRFTPPVHSEDQQYMLAPWCYLHDRQIYHDFRGKFEPAGQLAEIMTGSPLISHHEALNLGVSAEAWESWILKSYIVPVFK